MDSLSLIPLTMFCAAGLVGKSIILLLLATSIDTSALIVGAYSTVRISRSPRLSRADDGAAPFLAPIAPPAPAGGGGGK